MANPSWTDYVGVVAAIAGMVTGISGQLESDRATVEQIAASTTSEGIDFAALSFEQLGSEILAAHKIKTNLFTLIEKYRGALAADDDARRQIGEQHTAMAAARIQAAKSPR